MSSTLLKTKLFIPPARPGTVPRPHLIERLNEGLSRPLTLVSAPAGFGKTTLLSEWVAHPTPNARVAWLSLDESDNDLTRFLAYVVAALQTVEPGIGDAVPAMLHAPHPQPPTIESVVATLINSIAETSTSLALVLDDYHVIETQSIHSALTYLLDHMPPLMHLFIASRADPPLPLARLRGRGQLTELRQAALRCTPDETAEFLNRVMGLGLSAEDIAALASRTEGWIAGLQMAAASMQGREDIHALVTSFNGSQHHILDYLVEEVLQHQPDSVQSFLSQTSMLGRMSGPLCDALTGMGNGQAMLARLEQANLFVFPLDDNQRWYRYHRLFADLLQKRLGEAHPDLVPILHLRASVWHEQNGLMSEAIDHALSAGDFERAASLIEQVAEPTLMRSETVTLLRWLRKLPETQVRARPSLSVYYAWALLLDGSPIELVEAHLESANGRPEALSDKALPLHAFVAMYRGQISRAVELSQRALAQLPESEAFLRGIAALTLGVAHFTEGDTASGQRVLQDAARISQRTGNTMIAVSVLCYRAEVCRKEGQLGQARSLYQQALELATGQDGQRLPVASRALLGLGDIAREWNDLDAAVRHATQGIELAGRWTQIGAFSGFMTLARIRQAQGNWGSAHEAIQKMRQLAIQFDVTEIDDRVVDMFEALIEIAQGDLSAARRWASGSGLSGNVYPAELEKSDDFANRHLRKYEYPVLARLWMAEGRSAEVLALLESTLSIAEKMNRVGLVIEYQILIALASYALGQNEKGMQAVARALTLAEPEGYVRIFVDEGPPMARLLYEAASRGIKPEYAGRLLAAFPASAYPSLKQVAMIEPLSERELEVLRLIAEGLSNEEIAQRLVLSLPTVKWHTGNIYGKLSVKNRTEAVAKARPLGLLPN